MIDTQQLAALQHVLFTPANSNVFAVLDGCMSDALPTRLQHSGCEFSCLFSGRLDPSLAAAAPYLVALDDGHDGTHALLREGWNDHWGIVLATDASTSLLALRQHLRRFLRISGPGNRPFYFRFYDPRALREVLPNLQRQQVREFFGPVRTIYIEGDSPDGMLAFTPGGAQAGQSIELRQRQPA